MSTKKLPYTSQGQGCMASELTFSRVKEDQVLRDKIKRRVLEAIKQNHGKYLRKDAQHVAPRIYGYTGDKPVVFYRVGGTDLVKVTVGEKQITITSGKTLRTQLPL